MFRVKVLGLRIKGLVLGLYNDIRHNTRKNGSVVGSLYWYRVCVCGTLMMIPPYGSLPCPRCWDTLYPWVVLLYSVDLEREGLVYCSQLSYHLVTIGPPSKLELDSFAHILAVRTKH